MRWRGVGFVFAIGALVTGSAAEKRWPRFEDYPAKVRMKKRKAEAYLGKDEVDTEGKEGEALLRAGLQRVAREGPDFAGHYVIAGATCGTDCGNFWIVGVRSAQMVVNLGTLMNCFDRQGNLIPRLDYRLNSRLLIIRAAPQDESVPPCVERAYVWDESDIKLIGERWYPEWTPDPPTRRYPRE